MIAHMSIGVRDIDRSKRFYDAALEPLGYKCLRAAKSLLGYGYGRDSISFWIFQAEHPLAMIQAVRKVVHEHYKPKQAYDYYLTLAQDGRKQVAGTR